MKENHFTYRELFEAGWEKTKAHFWFVLSAVAIYALVAAVVFPIPLIGSIASMLLTIAVVTVTLRISRDHTPEYEDFRRSLRSFSIVWHYFVASILYTLAVIAGFILFVIPGIVLAIRLQFYMYAIVEHEHDDPIESLKRSWNMTRGHFWKLFGFLLVSCLLIAVSAIPLGLGLLFSLPVVSIAYAYLYRKLAHKHVTTPETNN